MLVFAAGLVDDLVPNGPRGIRDHLGALASGHVSTGIVKVLVIVASAVVAVALQPERPGWVRVAGVVLVAACANVWNGLDVRPGRAIKFGLVAMVGLVGVDLAMLPTLPGVAVASVLALWPDLRERAMLGDGGANLLGFTIGLGLSLVLADAWVVVAAGIAVVDQRGRRDRDALARDRSGASAAMVRRPRTPPGVRNTAPRTHSRRELPRRVGSLC